MGFGTKRCKKIKEIEEDLKRFKEIKEDLKKMGIELK
jgi:uncharacterized protein with GYD domain